MGLHNKFIKIIYLNNNNNNNNDVSLTNILFLLKKNNNNKDQRNKQHFFDCFFIFRYFFSFYQKTECEIDCVCYLYVFKWIPYGNEVKYEPVEQYIHYITGRI